MRSFWLIPVLLFAARAGADQCGLYQIEDYGDRVVYTLSDFSSQRPMTLNYRITNNDSDAVSRMVNGLCYCVDGEPSNDPAYPNDPLYKLLQVTRVKQGPWQSCGPLK